MGVRAGAGVHGQWQGRQRRLGQGSTAGSGAASCDLPSRSSCLEFKACTPRNSAEGGHDVCPLVCEGHRFPCVGPSTAAHPALALEQGNPPLRAPARFFQTPHKVVAGQRTWGRPRRAAVRGRTRTWLSACPPTPGPPGGS